MASTPTPAEDAPAVEPPAPDAPDERTTAEILAAAPPLILPEGMRVEKVCPQCGLMLRPDPSEDVSGKPCPNCRQPLP